MRKRSLVRQPAFRKALVVIGYGSAPANHWQRWLTRKLTSLGVETRCPDLPDRFAVPDMAKWLKVLRKSMDIDESTVIVAHSMGCPTTLQLLKDEGITSVGSLILVAPSSLSRVLNSDFAFLEPFFVDLDPATATKAKHVEVYTSENDRWVNPYTALQMAIEINAQFNLIPGAGHMNTQSGQYTFPQLLDLIAPLVESV
jgi:uncharacterized protein